MRKKFEKTIKKARREKKILGSRSSYDVHKGKKLAAGITTLPRLPTPQQPHVFRKILHDSDRRVEIKNFLTRNFVIESENCIGKVEPPPSIFFSTKK